MFLLQFQIFTVGLSTRLSEVQREDGVNSGLHGGVGGLVLLALREGQLGGLCGFFFSPSLPFPPCSPSLSSGAVWLCPTQLRGCGGGRNGGGLWILEVVVVVVVV